MRKTFLAGCQDLTSTMRKTVHASSDQIPIPAEPRQFERVAGWHIHRHTLASMYLAGGKSQVEVKEMIGWCDDQIASRYQHLSRDRKRQLLKDVSG